MMKEWNGDEYAMGEELKEESRRTSQVASDDNSIALNLGPTLFVDCFSAPRPTELGVAPPLFVSSTCGPHHQSKVPRE